MGATVYLPKMPHLYFQPQINQLIDCNFLKKTSSLKMIAVSFDIFTVHAHKILNFIGLMNVLLPL